MSTPEPTAVQRGHRILAGLGLVALLAWAYFAWRLYLAWLSLGETMDQQAERVEVSDQGLLNLLAFPLVMLFAFQLARLLKQAKKGEGKPGWMARLACAGTLVAAVALPLWLTSGQMEWFLASASAVDYRFCAETRHGKGKNNWRVYEYTRSDLVCP
ncbi:MAG TPA: hypothetical protein VFV28_04370 [Limnobacter sp.]|nr:hypothetical protein [Limnobacter sp.]